MKSKIKYISFIISINSIIFINNVSAGISENKHGDIKGDFSYNGSQYIRVNKDSSCPDYTMNDGIYGDNTRHCKALIQSKFTIGNRNYIRILKDGACPDWSLDEGVFGDNTKHCKVLTPIEAQNSYSSNTFTDK